MADKILIFILCLSGYAVSQTVDLTGNCSESSPPEPFFVTGVDRPALSCDILGTSSCSNGDLPPSVSGPFMGPPASLDLDFIQYSFNGELFPKLEVTWTPPKSAAGINELKGFYIIVHKLTGGNGPDSFCRVFDLSQNNFTAGDHKLQFTKTFVQLTGGPNYLYLLDLYTLPYSPESERLRKLFTLQSPQSENNTGDWRAAMSYSVQNVSAPAQISVEFSLAPTRFNFKKYELLLIDSRDKDNSFSRCMVSVDEAYECQGNVNSPPGPDEKTFTHTFLDIPAGTYSVWVQPYDPFWQSDNCLCYKESDGKRDCIRCTTTMLNESIIVEGAIPTPPTSTSTPPTTPTSTSTSSQGSDTGDQIPAAVVVQPKDNSTLLVAAILGSLMGLALVALLAFYIWKKRRSGDITLPFFANNNKMNSQPPTELTKKKICMVYTSDHPLHITVVEKLARYLNDHCACQVFFMPWFQGETRTHGCYEWILTRINQSDYVLIINSEAAFKLYEARNNNTSFRMEDKGPEEDVFSMAMSHLMAGQNQPDFYKRNILTYFEYTTEDFLMKDLSPGIQYKLPKHLRALLCHIHMVETYTQDSRLPIIEGFADVQSKPEGRALMEAITKAKNFQKQNPFWFAKNFHRQDSAYDSSSSPDLDQEPDSVSTGPRFDYPPIYDDESKSTITYNTNYQKIEDPEAMSAVTYNTHYQNLQPGFPLAPSTVVTTTTAPTEVFVDKLARINHHGINNPAFNNDTHVGESSPDDFLPPSEVQEDDIEEQLMNINRESLTPLSNSDPAYQNMQQANGDSDPSSVKFYPASYENLAGPKNIPRMYDDDDSDVSDGRDV